MSLPDGRYLLLSLTLALAISGMAWRVRALTTSGACAATLVGFLVMGWGGATGGIALLLFFVSSSALSRLGKKRKASLGYEKSGERDASQVLANGGVAALSALLLVFFPHNIRPMAMLLGALAAANADTWATEIGSLAAFPPRLITNLRPAPVGSSGAISAPGTLASLVGALLIGTVLFFGAFGLRGVLTVAISGLTGSLFDSLLGATIQVQYRCTRCHKLTERKTHHDLPTERARGITWMNNDAVNFLATLCGAIVAASLFPL